MNQIQKLTQAIRDNAECQLDYGTIRTLKMIDDESIKAERSAMCEADSNAVLYDSLPGYDEIDQVANDEANGIDWDSLRYAGIYTDGFIAGALWMKSKIKK